MNNVRNTEKSLALLFLVFLCLTVFLSYGLPMLFLNIVPEPPRLFDGRLSADRFENDFLIKDFPSFASVFGEGALMALPALVFLLPRRRELVDLVILIPLVLLLHFLTGVLLEARIVSLTVSGFFMTLSLLKDAILAVYFSEKHKQEKDATRAVWKQNFAAYLLALSILISDVLALSFVEVGGGVFLTAFENTSISLILASLSVLSILIYLRSATE